MANLWQQPHVNVFKHFNLTSWKKASKEGEVTTLMDKTVKATVLKITGHIPAGNYIQLPLVGSQSLGLTGRYFYLLFRPIPTKYFVVHVDVATKDSLVIRLSFSNLFKEFKSTSTWLQFPFLCNPSKETVAFHAASGAREFSGPAPTSTRWTVLCLDLSYILSMYVNRSYSHIKGMRLCANMYIKNVFTSDIIYDPGISLSEAKKMGGGRHVAPLPREFGFPLQKGDSWHDVYDLIRFPPEGEKKPFDSVQYAVDDSNRGVEEDEEGRPRRVTSETKNVSKCVSERVSMIHKLTTPKEYPKKQAVTKELPELDLNKYSKEVDDSNVHIYSHPLDLDEEMTRDRLIGPKKIKDLTTAPIQQCAKPPRTFKTLEPDPILKLKRIIGFGGGTSRDVLWSGDRSCVIYPCHAVVVVMRISNGHQRFFIGHTDKVSCLALSGNNMLLASGQTGHMSIVRVWKFQSGECLSISKTHAHSLFCLSFAPNGNVLCGVGKDGQGKNLVVIWNTSILMKKHELSIVAKAHTDVDIARMIVAPFDEMRLVSCGRENVRLWRVKDGTLRSAPVNLGEHHGMEFTDVCFECSFQTNRNPEDRLIYACSRTGHVFEIDYQKIAVHHVRRLFPIPHKMKRAVAYGSGLAITSISMNETFCATGSEDGYLRLWPLDFAHVYLEAEHEGAVTAVSLSSDGLKILAGTCTGNLGILDVSSRDYTTIIRSHSASVLSVAIDPYRKHMATVSRDHSIRVWDAETLQQLYDFSAPEECPTAICYHPNCQIFVCGFESGAVRVFNVQSTCLVAELRNHKGSITGVQYSHNGEFLFTSCSQGSLASYAADQPRYPNLRFSNNIVARGTRFGPEALAVSGCGRKIAFVGPSEFTVTIVDSCFLSELVRVDVTNLNPESEKECVDTATRVAFAPSAVGHLLVTTANNRLLKLDASSGRLIAEVSNIHRSGCTSLTVTSDGRHLVTAGDKVVKVWDYNMRLDINFQVFIGHSDKIRKVLITPDQLSLISCGEAIYLWDNLALRSSTPPIEGRQPLQEETVPEKQAKGDPLLDVSGLEYPRRAPPQPIVPSLPSARVEDLSSIQNEDDVEVGTVESDQSFALGKVKSTNQSLESSDKSTVKDLEVGRSPGRSPSAKPSKENAFVKHSPHWPRPFSQAQKSQENLLKEVPSVFSAEEMPVPTCRKHFKAREKRHAMAQRHYTAPPNQAGLRVASVIGYDGNGCDNMVWSPDTGLFIYTNGSLVVIEDLSTGRQTFLQGHHEAVSTLAVKNDYQGLVSASGAYSDVPWCQICVWDLTNRTLKKTLTRHKSQVVSMAFSRDDRFLITVGDYLDSELVVWSSATYTVVATTSLGDPVNCVTWDPFTVNEFATVGEHCTVCFWLLDETSGVIGLSVHGAEVPEELMKGDGEVEPSFTALEYGGDSTLFVASTNGKVSAWDTRHNSCFMHWNADDAEIDVLVSCVSGKLLTGSGDGNLRIWSVGDISGMKEPGIAGRVSAGKGLIMEDEMMLDGAVIAASFDDNLEMGIVGTGTGTLWYINWIERTSIRLISGHSQKVTGVAMTIGGLMATSCEDGSVRVWTLHNKEQALQFQVKDQVCSCVAFAPALVREPFSSLNEHIKVEPQVVPTLIAGYNDGTVRMFDVNAVEMILKLRPHSVPVTAIAVTGDGQGSMILSGSNDGTIAVSSAVSGMTVRVISDHRGAAITDMDVAPAQVDPFVKSPQMWLACSGDRRVSVWSSDWDRDICDLVDWLTFPAPNFTPEGGPAKGKKQVSLLPPSLARFSPHEPDTIVYTGYGMNKCVQFYSLSQRKVLRTVSLTHWARCMDICPGSPLVTVGIDERLLKVIDYYEGSFQDFTTHDDSLAVVRFTPDGSQLVSAAHVQVIVWDVTV